MTRLRTIVVAAVFAILAFDDGIAPAAAMAQHRLAPIPRLATAHGRVILSGAPGGRTIEIRTPAGRRVRLAGPEAAPLASVDGADVRVRGTWSAGGGLTVRDFQVVAVKGRPALDGVLMLTPDGCALRQADGSIRNLAGVPDRIALHVGDRLWVIGSASEPPVEFGAIAGS